MSQSRQPRVREKTFYGNVDDYESERDDVSSAASHSGSSSSEHSDDDQSVLQKLPTLPDLRFEQSYLATIRGFMHEDEAEEEHDVNDVGLVKAEGEPDHHHRVSITRSKAKEGHELWLGNLRVEWFPILYVTVRDQLISPLVQGAIWGLGGILVNQFRQYIAANARLSPLRRSSRTLRHK